MACLLAPALAVDASVLNLVALCKDANFNGACYGSPAPDNTCVDFIPSFNDVVTSLLPSPFTGVCTFYRDYGCSGPSFTASFPGLTDLAQSHPTLNNELSSLKCAGL
ncbi:hypothetical protein VE00_10949 [Pseudogymnoascus sp. WSF 3629]|nr:hypothetical protein VE00_10949 [Pseudogymnoascus sp. WSF 3629]